MALRSSDACCWISQLVISNHAGTLSTKVPCHEKLLETNSRRSGYCHNGRADMEDLEKHIQSRVQCESSYDLNIRDSGRDCKVLRTITELFPKSKGLSNEELDRLSGFGCNWKSGIVSSNRSERLSIDANLLSGIRNWTLKEKATHWLTDCACKRVG